MIRRSTVVYIVILLAMLGTFYYLRNREQPSADIEVTPEPTQETITYLFTAADGVPTSLHIEANTGEVVEVARDADNAWRVILPIEGAAEQGSAEAAASQVTTMRVLESIPQIDLDLVGLSDPAYILNVTFSGGKERTVNIGVVTPTESGYYVQDAAGGDVLIVSKSSLDSILGMLTLPPYLETPTPSPMPTDTQLPVTATPEAGTPTDGTATPQS
jgi:uncharacterized protein DUF4340